MSSPWNGSRSRPSAWLREVVAWCLPAGCLSCGEPLPAIAPLSLCARCRRALAGRRRTCCRTCSRETGAAGAGVAGKTATRIRCERCRAEPPAFDELAALWDYDELTEPVIHGLKFAGLRYLGRHIATAMHERLAHAIESTDVVTPVPLHPWRLLTRGYNQAADITIPLARLAGKPHGRLLTRTRATPPQRGLARAARRRNLTGAFRAHPSRIAPGARILLVDDVVTTGATLHAAAVALRSAGAGRIVALAAGRTPEPGVPDGAPDSDLDAP